MKIYLCFFAIILLSSKSFASSIVSQPCDADPKLQCIQKFEGLEIEGGVYNLELRMGAFRELFPSPETDILNFNDADWAFEAGDVIQALLRSIAPNTDQTNTRFIDFDLGNAGSRRLHMPFVVKTRTFPFPSTLFDSSCVALNTGGISSGHCVGWGLGGEHVFGVFEEATVPNPSTFALVCFGIFGLGFARRKSPAITYWNSPGTRQRDARRIHPSPSSAEPNSQAAAGSGT